MYNENNIFYKIIKGDIKANIIMDNSNALSFYDIAPKAPIHALVIPKGKYINALDFCQNATMQEMADFNKTIADTIEKLNITDGFRVISNSGVNGGQEVPHYHIHILAGKKLGKMLAD